MWRERKKGKKKSGAKINCMCMPHIELPVGKTGCQNEASV